MSLQTSMAAARTAVSNSHPTYLLSCSCGWETHESRAHVIDRVARHFSYPDAKEAEHISIEPKRD